MAEVIIYTREVLGRTIQHLEGCLKALASNQHQISDVADSNNMGLEREHLVQGLGRSGLVAEWKWVLLKLFEAVEPVASQNGSAQARRDRLFRLEPREWRRMIGNLTGQAYLRRILASSLPKFFV
ncbi:hypothetical protein LWI28_018252 [Acer negundo]|uniref:Uncharacterized protein n=1 Tax=Acer negundo TaxID=4023 RepID=A0AAD5JA57_ACENE|nr:hypothetical protein LWI28_018252 [Acer negundo]